MLMIITQSADSVAYYKNVFFIFVASGQVGAARWLLNCDLGGKLITAKDKNGDTAAHDAADNG